MNRNKLYVLLSTACLTGYVWLAVTWNPSNSAEPGACLFKRLTGIPCPSCGSTRSVLALLHGDFSSGIYWNPFGIILISILLLAPLWILFDVVFRRQTLFSFYNQTERIIRRKWIAIALILLVILNWIWNIYKGL